MEDMMNMLFEKKADEFMKYQRYLYDRFSELFLTLFTEDVVKVIEEYAKITHHCLQSESKVLWFRNASSRHNYLTIEFDPNIYSKKFSLTDAKRKGGLFYDRPEDINELKGAAADIKLYEKLLNAIEREGVDTIKKAFEWKKGYVEEQIALLNDMDFSMPNEKPKKYIIKISIEEV